MKTLLAFEFRKLLIRRMVWVVLTLCAAVQLLSHYENFRMAMGGAVGSMRQVYARYEGQVLTAALQVQILDDYQAYAAAHPDTFKASTMEWGYWPQNEQLLRRGPAMGMLRAYENLLYANTWESIQQSWQQAKVRLASGKDSDGQPLRAYARRNYEQLTSRPPLVPIVRFDLGWTSRSQYSAMDLLQRVGVPTESITIYPSIPIWVLLLLVSAVPGFAADKGLEPVVLISRRRKTAALAKTLASAAFTATAVLVLRLLDLLLQAATLGLDGWNQPAVMLLTNGIVISNLSAWALHAVLLVLAAAACAALLVGGSALYRGPLPALGAAIALLAAQYALASGATAAYRVWMINPAPQYLEPWWAAFCDALSQAVPVVVLGQNPLVTWWNEAAMLAAALAVGLLALALWLSPRLYCRRRKV